MNMLKTNSTYPKFRVGDVIIKANTQDIPEPYVVTVADQTHYNVRRQKGHSYLYIAMEHQDDWKLNP